MKKQLANIVTSTRILAAVFLYFFSSVNALFLGIYGYCGFTDLIDGPIARKTNSTSNLGATLDTVGDVATYVALAKILIAQSLVPIWVLVWFCISAVGILSSALVSKKRFNQFYIIHSLFGKIMGGCVFALPFAVFLNLRILCYCAICLSATISAFESVIIQAKVDSLDANIISLYQLHKNNKAGH